MSSSSSPPLPTHHHHQLHPPSTTTTTTTTTSDPTTNPAFRAFLSRLTTTLRHTLSQRRPWLELLDRSALSRPDTLSEAATRIRKNSSYFRVNYLLLLTFSLLFSLISHPFSLLLLLSLLAAWCFLYLFRPSDTPLVLLGRSFSDRETLGILVISTIVIVFLTSVGSLLISSLLIGVSVICAHGAFRVPEDLFLDDQEGPNSGLLSFLGGSTASAVAAAGSSVASRV